MSFRDTQKALAGTQKNTTKYVIANQTPEYNGLAKKSRTFFLMLFGKTTKSKKGEYLTLNEVFGLAEDGSQLLDKSGNPLPAQVLRFDKATFKVTESGEKGRYVNWHFTGENDPLVVLGYGHERNGNLTTVPAEVNKIPQRNNAKLNKIYNGSMNFAKFLQTQIHCPVILFSGDDFTVANGTPAILVLTLAQFKDVIKLGENFSTTSKQNKSLYGRILQLNKDSSLGMKAYSWLLPQEDVDLPANIDEVTQTLLENEEKVLEGIYNNVNGGSADSANVWNYLLNLSGLTYEQFVARYNIKLNDTIDPTPSSVITFDDDDENTEETETEGQPF